ncbi:MAG: hypothetical protein AB7O81_34870 [Blastocatellales bacterium]
MLDLLHSHCWSHSERLATCLMEFLLNEAVRRDAETRDEILEPALLDIPAHEWNHRELADALRTSWALHTFDHASCEVRAFFREVHQAIMIHATARLNLST